ncbi:MAG: tRNA glutamyl-Q(34) synthetase GluQRS [Xanthomonadales bacterium]
MPSKPGPAAPTGPTGRFAPSPTGDLHFGSLVAAVASFLEAKSRGGQWLVRIEDIDPPREVAGSAERILAALQAFGLRSDRPVVFQSQRTAAYRAARDRLLAEGKAFWCGCSRADLPASGVYPGTCRSGLPAGKSPRSVRLRVDDATVRFRDAIQGEISEHLPATVGDFVIWRADDLPAYQLAVVVDDAWQGVDECVRGHDLLASTARQIQVARALGLSVPRYAHHPVATTPDGRKLAKRLRSDPLERQARGATLRLALDLLGQRPPTGLTLAELWRWALSHWRLDRVPRRAAVEMPPAERGARVR